MRKFLVEDVQPFGQVSEMRTGLGMPCETGFMAKPLGPTEVRMNGGVTHAPSFADPGANGQAIANRGQDNPFMFTGRPR